HALSAAGAPLGLAAGRAAPRRDDYLGQPISPARIAGIGRLASSAWKHCWQWVPIADMARSVSRFRCRLEIGASWTSLRNRSVAALIAGLPFSSSFTGSL